MAVEVEIGSTDVGETDVELVGWVDEPGGEVVEPEADVELVGDCWEEARAKSKMGRRRTALFISNEYDLEYR